MAFGTILRALLGGRPPPSPHRRAYFDKHPAAIYAIGDIHGCYDQLIALESEIVDDAASIEGEIWILTLGDVVDRGPASARVIDRLRAPAPRGIRRVNIMGNHEAMMLDFALRPRPAAMWLENGGRETLASYGVPPHKLETLNRRTAEQIVASYIPQEHIDYLQGLPCLLETPAAIFVHAGLRPGFRLTAQKEADLLWYRDEYEAHYAEFGKPIVHGHTVRDNPLVTPFRVAVDTGAASGGPLTAARVNADGSVKLISTPPLVYSQMPPRQQAYGLPQGIPLPHVTRNSIN